MLQSSQIQLHSPPIASEPLSMRVKRLEEELSRAQTGTIFALSMLLDLKDLKTGLHATRLAAWAVRVAERLGVGGDELQDIEIASVLHDIGKVGVPDSILLKPGRLSAGEMATVRKHPEYGWGILRSIPGFERASLLVLHHHERWDGAGYPSGLRGDEIPLGARIVAVVDTFDAMLSNRPYRHGLAVSEVVARLRPEAGAQFDPRILDQFLALADLHLEEILQIREPVLGPPLTAEAAGARLRSLI